MCSAVRYTREMKYFVYILRCSDGTLYTGSTPNLEKRVSAHNDGKTGAKYTRGRRPVELVYSEKYKNKSEALKREHVVKKLTRAQKEALFLGA